LQYYLLDTVKIESYVIESKDEIDWVFRLDHMTLAFTVSERQYCKKYPNIINILHCKDTLS